MDDGRLAGRSIFTGEVFIMSIQPQIVYVDSDLESCSFVETLLTEVYRLPTVAVTDPTRMLELSADRPFDLYLMDYCFPQTTAVELCHSLRMLNVDSPIVVYSVLDRDIDRRLASEAGADLFLSKPDDLPILGQELFRLLDSRPRRGDFMASRLVGTINLETPSLIKRSRRIRLRRKGAGIL